MDDTNANNSFNFIFRSIVPYVQSACFKPGPSFYQSKPSMLFNQISGELKP